MPSRHMLAFCAPENMSFIQFYIIFVLFSITIGIRFRSLQNKLWIRMLLLGEWKSGQTWPRARDSRKMLGRCLNKKNNTVHGSNCIGHLSIVFHVAKFSLPDGVIKINHQKLHF